MATYSEGRMVSYVQSTIWKVLISVQNLRANFLSSRGKRVSVLSVIQIAQPMMIANSHLGKFAIVTVAKVNNTEELVQGLLRMNMHFSEMSMGKTNPTELIALLIVQGKDL